MSPPLEITIDCSDLDMGIALAKRAGAKFFGYDEEAIGVELIDASEGLVFMSGDVATFRCRFVVHAYGSGLQGDPQP